MSDRISIHQLRDPDRVHADDWVWLNPGELAALLDAVEAARDCWRTVAPNGNDRFQLAAHDKLRDSLARFDFTEAG